MENQTLPGKINAIVTDLRQQHLDGMSIENVIQMAIQQGAELETDFIKADRRDDLKREALRILPVIMGFDMQLEAGHRLSYKLLVSETLLAVNYLDKEVDRIIDLEEK